MKLASLPNVNSMQPDESWRGLSGAQLAQCSGLVSFVDAGFPCYSPVAQLILCKMESILRHEASRRGFNEMKVPVVHRQVHLEAASISDEYKEQFFRLDGALKGFILSATSEEFFLTYIHKYGGLSYRQLPMRTMQFQDAFRYIERCEGLYKSRSFYGCVFTFLDRDTPSYLESLKCFSEIVEVLMQAANIPYRLVTSSDGRAVEYLSSCPEGDRQLSESIAARKSSHDVVILEHDSLPTGKDFSSIAMGYEYEKISKYKLKLVKRGMSDSTPMMGTCGVGLQRCLCLLLQHNSDDKGLNLPRQLRPWDVVVLLVGARAESSGFGRDIYDRLLESNLSILWDDRHNKTMKEKMAFADFWGIETRVLIGPKEIESKTVEIRFRSLDEEPVVTRIECLLEVVEGD